MSREKHKKRSRSKKVKNIHKIIKALQTFFEILQLLKAIIEFFH